VLQFKKDDNAVFCGIEAEGPMKGLPTLFVVGEPTLKAFIQTFKGFYKQLHKKKKFGVYFGAGSSLVIPSILCHYLQSLKGFVKKHDLVLKAITVEALFDNGTIAQIVEDAIAETFPGKRTKLFWVSPVYWKDQEKELRKTSFQLVVAKHYAKFARFKMLVKVYVARDDSETSIVMIAPLEECWFADVDSNTSEYNGDKLLTEESC
jgi:hypothetical protein